MVRKTNPAPSEKATPPEEAEPSTAEVSPPTANVVVGEHNAEPREEAAPVAAKKRPGRVASPLTALIRAWEQAKKKTEVAVKHQAKARQYDDDVTAAKANEREAYEAMQKALADGAPTE